MEPRKPIIPSFTPSPELVALRKRHDQIRQELKTLKSHMEEKSKPKPEPGTVAFANQHYRQYHVSYNCFRDSTRLLVTKSTKPRYTVSSAIWGTDLIAIKATTDALAYQQADHEIAVLQKLSLLPDSPAVGFLGYRYQNLTYSIMMEYTSKGSLENYFLLHPVSLSQQYTLIQNITAGLAVLHDNQIIHCHIKPAHILVWDDQLKVKFCSFTQSKKPDDAINVTGTPLYYPPEVLTAPATDKSDIFSASIVFWQILSDMKEPYQDQLQTFRKGADLVNAINTGMRPVVPSSWPKKLRAILNWMWQTDPALRPTAKALVEELKTDIDTLSDNLQQIDARLTVALPSSTRAVTAQLLAQPTPRLTVDDLVPGTVAFANHHYQLHKLCYEIRDDVPIISKERLGVGAFGTVYKASWHGHDVAVKEVNGSEYQLCCNELANLQIMSLQPASPVIGFLGYRFIGATFQLFTEYAPHGNLEKYLKQHPALSMATRYTLMKMIVSNLVVMHENHFLHDDIKPANILVCNDNPLQLKFCDLALSRFPDNTTNTQGTPLYLSPEKGRHPITDKSDIFSTSIVFWRLVAGMRDPYHAQKFLSCGALLLAVQMGLRETIPPECPYKISKIIQWMWQPAPSKRPTATELALEFQTDMHTVSDKLLSLHFEK